MKLEAIRAKLKALLDERGLSMRSVSLRAGLKHNAVSNIFHRTQVRANYDSLEKILNVLGVPFGEFYDFGEGSKPPPVSPPANMHLGAAPPSNILVPDCGTISAGPFRLTDPGATEHFVAGGPHDKDSFILTISGDSMAPDYINGEMIFLRRENIHLVSLPREVKVGVPIDRVQHLNGHDCVVFMKDEGSTFKRIKIIRGKAPEYTVVLNPVNPAHDKTVIKPEHDLWIQGVCYKSVRKR